ncbi:MAG: diaminopimelate epimerase [Fusobacteriaceae bacterium]
MRFWKMQAAGNDFILADGYNYKILDGKKIAKTVCDRHFGVGADGFMFPEKSSVAQVKMNYFNSDGSLAEMCGNGIRCFAKFVYERGIVESLKFSIETLAGIKDISLKLYENGEVEKIDVEMGEVDFRSSSIPVIGYNQEVLLEKLDVLGEEFLFSSLLMGVPHTVIFVEDFSEIDIAKIGSAIENHPSFPQKTNVNFAKILDSKRIEIKTWERGAGHTLGCGTGCCATGALAHRLGKTQERELQLFTEGGKIEISIGEGYGIKMSGWAENICTGEILKEIR